MQVFNAFFRIAKKHMAQLIIYTGIFMLIIVMMSMSAKKSAVEKFSATAVDLIIDDQDNSEISRGLREYLGERHNIVELRDNNTETIVDNLFYQKISYALTIPAGFGESFEKGGDIKLSHNMRKDEAAGFFVNEQIDAYLKSVSLYMEGGYSLSEAINLTYENVKAEPEVEALVFEEKSLGENETMYYYFQYLAYVFLMIFTMILVPILVTFQNKNISARIQCSAITNTRRNFQIGAGCAVFSIVLWTIFVIVAAIWFGPDNVFSEKGRLILINNFVFTLIATAIPLLLSAFNLKDGELNLVANIIGLGMSFLCGIFVPQWLLSDQVLSFSKFLPAYWYIKNLNMLDGWSGEIFSLANFWRYTGIQMLFLLAIFSVYLVASKYRRK